jgi:phage-related protein
MEAGHCPVAGFLDSLDKRQAQKVTWVLRLVEELAVVPAKYFKKLSGFEDVWEVRIDFGSDTFRLLGFFDGPGKKTQKVPKQAIDLAQERRKDYLRRKGHE